LSQHFSNIKVLLLKKKDNDCPIRLQGRKGSALDCGEVLDMPAGNDVPNKPSCSSSDLMGQKAPILKGDF